VHVSGNKVRGYNEMTAVGNCVTADGTKTRVHACVPMVSVMTSLKITSSLCCRRAGVMVVEYLVEHSLLRRKDIRR